MSAINEQVTLSVNGKVAVITLNIPKKLNALTRELYDRLADLLREIAEREDIYITVLTGKGRYFSAYVSPNTEKQPILADPHFSEAPMSQLPDPSLHHPSSAAKRSKTS